MAEEEAPSSRDCANEYHDGRKNSLLLGTEEEGGRGAPEVDSLLMNMNIGGAGRERNAATRETSSTADLLDVLGAAGREASTENPNLGGLELRDGMLEEELERALS